MKIAVVGATGLVGKVILQQLEKAQFEIDQIFPVASTRSVGKELTFKGQILKVMGMQEAIDKNPDIALFSAGGNTSLEWAPKFAEKGCIVIDNSSAWRMDPNVPLVVPEINANSIGSEDKIIANPNCSTIQMVMALAPLHEAFKIERVIVSTYQSFTGTGVKAVKQYQLEQKGYAPKEDEMAYPHPIFANCIPHCDVFLENDYTKEEMKMIHETRKILGAPDLKITSTAVRVPVYGGHSESVNVEFQNPFQMEEVRDILKETKGIILQDDPKTNKYPMPLLSHEKDEVFVGRLRRDESVANGLNMWVVADNLRKGAATNAVQIAEHLCKSIIQAK